MRPSGVKSWVYEMVSADAIEATPAEPIAMSARMDMVSLPFWDNGVGIVGRGNDRRETIPTEIPIQPRTDDFDARHHLEEADAQGDPGESVMNHALTFVQVVSSRIRRAISIAISNDCS